MENTSAIRDEIRRQYDSKQKQFEKVHSKGWQFLGIIGSVIWPVTFGFGLGGGVGLGIGIVVLIGFYMFIYYGFSMIALGLYVIGVVFSFFGMVSNAGINRRNKKIAEERRQLTNAANAAIAKYDADVDTFCRTALGNSGIEPMVVKTVEMFKRMISHQESGAAIKYIEVDFYYRVNNTGIEYVYESGYSNPESEFNFKRERFHDLNSYEECEGLAKALSILVVAKMREEYPSDLTTIRVSNQDALFNLHFKTANENFEAAKDIF